MSKILLICRTAERGFDKYENLKFQQAAQKLGHELDIIPIPQLNLDTVLKGKYDIILPRTGSGTGTSTKVLEFLALLEHNGLRVINAAAPSLIAKDKYAALEFLNKSMGMPVPDTLLVTLANLNKIRWDRFPAVAKAKFGARGNSVFLINNLAELTPVVETYQEVVLQDFIAESKGRDLRILVSKNGVIGAIERESTTADFRANFSLGASTSPYQIPPSLAELALEACQKLGLDYCGCDFLFGNNIFYLCEINIHPDFEGFEMATGIDVATAILKTLS